MLSCLIAINELKAVFPASFLVLSWVPLATVSIGMNALSWALTRKAFIKLDNIAYSAYLRTCLFIFENVSAIQINFYGDYEALVSKQESAIILSNHQSDTDWVVILMLAARQANGEHMLRVMVKDVIRYAPLFGWYIYQHGFIYVRRFKKFVLSPVLRQLSYLANLGEPFWLLIFPEGTRFSPRNEAVIKSSQEYCKRKGYPAFNSVLFPRANGFSIAVRELRKSLNAVYDITIVYGQARDPSRMRQAPNMIEFVCGTSACRTLHFHVRRFNITEIPEDGEAIKKWLADRYCLKNAMLEDFYDGKELPDLVVANAKLSPLSKTLPWACFHMMSILVAVFFPVPRKIFLATIISSPVLMLCLKARRAY